VSHRKTVKVQRNKTRLYPAVVFQVQTAGCTKGGAAKREERGAQEKVTEGQEEEKCRGEQCSKKRGRALH